jgi:hypothetical protein
MALEAIDVRRPWLPWAIVVVGSFLLFNANFRELGGGDTIPATFLPASLLRDGDLILDEFGPILDKRPPDGGVTLRQQLNWSAAVRPVDGHLRSSYPVGAAFLAVPVYAAPVAFGSLRDLADFRVAGKLAASLITALSAGFVYLTLRRFTTLGIAAFLAAAYALGTAVWTIASQALWQHGPALLCLSLATWAALRLSERDRLIEAVLISVALAMAVVCRPQNAIGALAIGLFALVQRPRRWPALLAPALCIMTWQIAYNLQVFGRLTGGYPDIYRSPAMAWRGLDPSSTLTLPLAEGLTGLLFSGGMGLFLYSPVLAVGLVSLAVLAAGREFPLARYLAFWVVGSLVYYGKNRVWWGGTGYGPRYLTELALPLVLALGMVWPRLTTNPTLRIATVVLASYGIAVQALGAFTWECGWHTTPDWLDFHIDRVWDYRDTEIERCTDVLFTTGVKSAEFGPCAGR